MAGRGPVPSLCNGARAAGALQSHRPPTLPTRPLCPSCCYSLTSAPYPCAVAGIARGSPTPLMLRFPPRSPPSFSTTSHRQPHPPAPLGHCPDAASSSLGAAGAALLLLVVPPSAAAMRAVAGSDGSSLELFCAQISSSLDRTARRLTRAARPPRRDGRATPARPLDMASAVSTEQLVGMLGRRMRTSRRRCPSPRAADSPTSCLARSSSRVTELATPAAALLAADDEVTPTRVPRAGLGPLSLLATSAAGSTRAGRGVDQAPAPAPGRAEAPRSDITFSDKRHQHAGERSGQLR